MFLGCGFLSSHFFPNILPYCSHVVLVDNDRVEKDNYDNHIIPKGYNGKRKVTAMASMVQMLSSVPVTPVNMNIKSTKQLFDLNEDFKPDIAFCTFDNVIGRINAQQYATESNIPMVFAGITEGHIYVDWAESVILPSPTDDGVVDEMERIRDVCSRLEFRGLGVLTAGLLYYAFEEWYNNNKK